MSELKKVRQLSKSESREIVKIAIEKNFLTKNEKIRQVGVYDVSDTSKIFIINSDPILLQIDGEIYPSLFNEIRSVLPKVVVDEGAIKHILNGADVMAPGIVSFPSGVKQNDLVSIRTQNNKIIGIGIVMESFEEKMAMKKGKVIKTIHYVGDPIFRICSKLSK
jgi:PUA-domain protein